MIYATTYLGIGNFVFFCGVVCDLGLGYNKVNFLINGSADRVLFDIAGIGGYAVFGAIDPAVR